MKSLLYMMSCGITFARVISQANEQSKKRHQNHVQSPPLKNSPTWNNSQSTDQENKDVLMNDSDSTVSAYSQTKQTNNNNHHDDSMKHQKLFLVVIPFSVSSHHRKLPSWTSTLYNSKAFNNSHVRSLTCKPTSHAPFTVLASCCLCVCVCYSV